MDLCWLIKNHSNGKNFSALFEKAGAWLKLNNSINSIILKRQFNTDVEIVQCGYEDCEKSHSFGPAVRDHYLIHYVTSGCGIFESNSVTYHLKEGDGFLICPDMLTYYESDSKTPWEYIWVGFKGIKARELLIRAGLSEKAPIFSDKKVKCFFEDMIRSQNGKECELVILSKFYSFIAHLAQNNTLRPKNIESIKQQYVNQAVQYIKNNYVNKISINLIASKIGLNRSYFFEIFKEQTGMSPQQYLIAFRMEKACRLLSETNLKIADVARSVGYEDEFMFTRMFKSKKGISPSKYKKNISVNNIAEVNENGKCL